VGYRLHPGRRVQDEVRRIADRQLEQAIAALRMSTDPDVESAVGAARRRIRRIRALIRLVRSGLGDRHRAVQQRLRAVNRLLAPVADGEAIVETLARVAERDGGLLPDVVAAIRATVLCRKSAAGEEAALNDALETTAALLRAEREAFSRWTLNETGVRAIAPGLEQTVRAGRRAMTRAVADPTSEHYGAWRQRVKDHRLQLHLLQARCGYALALDERRLEELDRCLDERHHCAILEDVLTSDSSLGDAALGLRVVRRYERELREQARACGAQIHRETPTRFVRRVHRLWRASKQQRLRMRPFLHEAGTADAFLYERAQSA
jgi:hypothetical protein